MKVPAFLTQVSLYILFFLRMLSLPGQQLSPTCGTDQLYLHHQAQNPSILQLNQLFERRWQQQQLRGQSSLRQVHTIPVVVHLIHNNGPANLPVTQVQQAIDALNDGMRNRSFFNPQTGVDTEIELCLATRDPQGNATNGITRTQSALTQLVMETQDSALKRLTRWDPNLYLNIWIVDAISSQAVGPGVLGYATLPIHHGDSIDGIVGEAAYFDGQRSNISVFVHEVGHYLGLYHTFHGGCTNNNCLSDGDKVCDTPPDASVTAVACHASPNSCHTDEDDTSIQNPFRPQNMGGLGDQPDMITNYMDYGDFSCLDAFTLGQKDRMHFFLTNTRASLLQSPGCLSPCNSPVTADFNMTNLPVSVGSSLQLQYNGTGNVSTYDWQVNGQSFSQTANAQYPFTQIGTYIFSLTVMGPLGNCFDTHWDTVEVFCEPQAEINGWQAFILPGDTLRLTAGVGANSYTWLLNGTVAGIGPSFNLTTAFSNSVMIQLIVDNGVCQDTTARVVGIGGCGLYDHEQKSYWALEDSMMMDFTVNPPIIRKEGSMKGGRTNPLSTYIEQSVTISDEHENLMFYSNGKVVWDKNHQPMPNGSGLLGDVSTWQGVIAFPDPADPAIYYLFTLDAAENRYVNGLRYSKIDMRLRGGLGDVIAGQKNIYVMTTYRESMHAVYHANGRDVWLVVTKLNSFNGQNFNLIVIPITAQGVQSNTPLTFPIQVPTNFSLVRFSHSGQWLVSNDYLYHFDRQTGTPQLFMTLGNLGLARGIEFSPDESKIYYSETNIGFEGLVQYDLSLGVPAHISSSRTVLYTDTSAIQHMHKIEIGKDQKLYAVLTSSSGLHVIQNPNRAGTACNLQLLGAPFPHNFRWKSINLPDYIRGKELVDSLSLELQADRAHPCPGEYIKVWPELLRGNYSLDFQVVGDASFRQKGDTLILIPNKEDTLHIFARFRNACEIQHDSLAIIVRKGPFIDLGADQILCTSPIHVKADSFPHTQYLWSNTQTGPQASFNQAGLYWLTAIDSLSGCQHRDSIRIFPPPSVLPPDLGPNQSLCEGDVLVLNVNGNFTSIKWWDGQSQVSHTVFSEGKYWVEVTDACGNRLSDTIEISYHPTQQAPIQDSAFYCPGEEVVVDITTTGFSTYQWLDGSRDSIRAFSQTGTYLWRMRDQYGCDVLDSIYIKSRPAHASVNLSPSQLICEGDTLNLDASTTGWISYQWNDGFAGAIRSLSNAGTYILEVTDAFGCKQQDSMLLTTIAPADAPDLGPDQMYCPGEIVELQLEVDSIFTIINWWDGRSERLRNIDAIGTYWVEVVDSCGNMFKDTINISLSPQTQIDIPDSIFFCPEEDMQIDITTPQVASYLWDDGETTAFRTFVQVGNYAVRMQDIHACELHDSLHVGRRPIQSEINLASKATICEGESISIDPTTPGWIVYQWSDGHIGAAREFNQAGTYSLTAFDRYGCSAEAQIELIEQAPIPLPLPTSYSICLGDTVQIQLPDNRFSNFQWADSATSGSRKLWEAGVYSLTASDLSGCLTTANTEVIVVDCPYDVYLPNAFSPNGDGHNEWFGTTYRNDIQSYHLMIFNRWGNQMYESYDPNPGWDGKYKGVSCPEGVYVYFLLFRGLDGHLHQKRGTVTLIR